MVAVLQSLYERGFGLRRIFCVRCRLHARTHFILEIHQDVRTGDIKWCARKQGYLSSTTQIDCVALPRDMTGCLPRPAALLGHPAATPLPAALGGADSGLLGP
jgi:hypothetical protein